MDTGWIEAVMGLNERIVVTEARVGTHAARLIEIIIGEGDTTEAELLFRSSQKGLAMLRITRDELLRHL
jgi:hypothetical protein